MTLSLADWLATQQKGALTRLMHRTRLAWSTVSRARRGERVGLKAAVLISRATRGAVAEATLTHGALNDDDLLAEDEVLGDVPPDEESLEDDEDAHPRVA